MRFYGIWRIALALATIIVAPLIFSGCASMLYMGSETDTHDIHTRINSSAQFLKVEYHERRSTRDYSLIFEGTPLGVFGPLFDYPAVIKREIIGQLNLRYSEQIGDVPIEGGKLESDFISFNLPASGKGDGEGKIEFLFNKNFEGNLHKFGHALKISPDRLKLLVSCKQRSCSVAADPSIVGAGGMVQITAEEIVDVNRQKEIAAEEDLQRKKREAEAVRMKRLEKQASGCIDLLIGADGGGGRYHVVSRLDDQTYDIVDTSYTPMGRHYLLKTTKTKFMSAGSIGHHFYVRDTSSSLTKVVMKNGFTMDVRVLKEAPDCKETMRLLGREFSETEEPNE